MNTRLEIYLIYLGCAVVFAPGQVTVAWTGTPGIPPLIQGSGGLLEWGLLGAATETSSGVYKIIDLLPDDDTRRFYRIAP
jgi:hypothetical protein